jgi:RHS repeat-associated protein
MTHSTMSDDFRYGTDFDADFCVKRVTKVIHSSGSSYLGVTEYTYDGNDFSRMEKTTMGNHIFRKKIGDTIGYGLYNHTGYVGDIEKGYLKLSGMVDGCKWRTSASGQFMDFKLFYEAKLGRLALLKGPQWQQSFSYAEGNLSSVPDSMSFNGFSAFPFGTSVVQQNTSDAFGRMRNAQVGIYEYKNNGSEHSLVFGGIGVDYDPHGRISSSDAFSAGETLESRIYRYSGGCMIGYYDDWMEREVSFTRDCFGRVTSFDSEDGENIITIGYDQYGRRSFESGSLGTRSYTYMGRLLMSAVVGDITTSFSYGAFGLRSMKVTGSETIRYYYSDGRLLFTLSQNGDACSFLYDSLGPCAMVMDMVTYTLIRDTMGDIIAILDDEGRLLVRYDYDAWGRIVRKTMKHDSDYGIHDDVDHVADLAKKADRRCPFRYRGYVYDGETGLYYLGSRYYDPRTFLFLTMDEFAYADASVISGLDLYCYCNYDPVNYSDGSGHFPVLAILCGIAAVGLGLTIGGVASDNNAMTGIGLSMVAVPALISGGLAIAAGIGGATLTGVVGGITVAAGLGTATFATAEYQEAFTGDNWILDAGMSEGWYNGLMLTTATIATLGTFASSIGYSFRIKSITEIGSIDGTQYKGIKFEQVSPNGNVRLRSLEWHTHLHNGHYHWQLNKWDGLIRKGTAGRWTWWLGRL